MSRENKRPRLDSPPGSGTPNAVTNATASDPPASPRPSFFTSASFASVKYMEHLSERVGKLEQREQQQSGDEVKNILKVFQERLDVRNATISRQDAEIKDLRERVPDLHQKLLTTQAEHRQQLANATDLIRSGPYQHLLTASDRKQPAKTTKYWATEEWAGYPRILELKPQGRDDINTPVLPRFVWALGEIYVVRRDPKTNQWAERSSGYHLVVDMTSASKSMWMVYRYAQVDGNLKIQLDVKKDFDPLWYPFAQTTGSAFDAAQVYAKIWDWNGPQTPVGQLARSLKLVKDTKRNYTSKLTFVEPNLEEVKEAIEKGWSGHPRQ
ncbi:hypothetical protein SCUP234_06567 [Seiridium cupressi]